MENKNITEDSEEIKTEEAPEAAENVEQEAQTEQTEKTSRAEKKKLKKAEQAVAELEGKLAEGGVLADLAPTMLDIMGVPQPAEMTGKSLLIK